MRLIKIEKQSRPQKLIFVFVLFLLVQLSSFQRGRLGTILFCWLYWFIICKKISIIKNVKIDPPDQQFKFPIRRVQKCKENGSPPSTITLIHEYGLKSKSQHYHRNLLNINLFLLDMILGEGRGGYYYYIETQPQPEAPWFYCDWSQESVRVISCTGGTGIVLEETRSAHC